jgi:hypothetical protein
MTHKKRSSAKKNGAKNPERILRKRYVRVVKMGEEWCTYLQIDHQGFCVVSETSKRRAEWYGRMLGIALARMVERERADTNKLPVLKEAIPARKSR